MKRLNSEEKKAIASLRKLAACWPENLWLFCNGQKVYIMKKNSSGEHATLKVGVGGGMDPDYIVGTVDIDSDGGDW